MKQGLPPVTPNDVPMPDSWRCRQCRAPYHRDSPNLTILLGGYARVLCCNQYQLVEPERKRR